MNGELRLVVRSLEGAKDAVGESPERETANEPAPAAAICLRVTMIAGGKYRFSVGVRQTRGRPPARTRGAGVRPARIDSRPIGGEFVARAGDWVVAKVGLFAVGPSRLRAARPRRLGLVPRRTAALSAAPVEYLVIDFAAQEGSHDAEGWRGARGGVGRSDLRGSRRARDARHGQTGALPADDASQSGRAGRGPGGGLARLRRVRSGTIRPCCTSTPSGRTRRWSPTRRRNWRGGATAPRRRGSGR